MSKAYYPNLRAVTSKVRGNKQSKRKLQGFPRPLKGVLIYQKTAAQMVLPILSDYVNGQSRSTQFVNEGDTSYVKHRS